MSELVEFLRAQLDKDEQTARAATMGPWRWDIRDEGAVDEQPELVSTTAPPETSIVLTAAGEGGPGWVCVDPEDREHIARQHPRRALADVAAKRQLLDQYERLLASQRRHDEAVAELDADIAREEETGRWEGAGFPDVRQRALRREADYLTAMRPILEELIAAAAAVYADEQKDQQP